MGRAFEFRKARKMKRWAAMSKAFTRIGKDIVMEGNLDQVFLASSAVDMASSKCCLSAK